MSGKVPNKSLDTLSLDHDRRVCRLDRLKNKFSKKSSIGTGFGIKYIS